MNAVTDARERNSLFRPPHLFLTVATGPGHRPTTALSRSPEIEAYVEPTLTAGVSVVRVAGEVDLGTVAVLETALERAVTSSRRGVVVDLDEVTFCSVRGLRALVDAGSRARGLQVHFALLGASSTMIRGLRVGWPEAASLHDQHTWAPADGGRRPCPAPPDGVSSLPP